MNKKQKKFILTIMSFGALVLLVTFTIIFIFTFAKEDNKKDKISIVGTNATQNTSKEFLTLEKECYDTYLVKSNDLDTFVEYDKIVQLFNNIYYIDISVLANILEIDYSDNQKGICVVGGYTFSDTQKEVVYKGDFSDEYITMSDPFVYSDNKAYIAINSVRDCFDCIVEMNNNRIEVKTLDMIFTEYTEKFANTVDGIISKDRLLLYDKAIFSKNDKFGIIDFDGEVVVKPIYDFIYEIYPKVYCTLIGDKFGLLSSDGDILQSNKYDLIQKFDSYNKILLVEKDGKKGLINNQGIILLDTKYSTIGETIKSKYLNDMQYTILFGNCVPVSIDGKYGVCSFTGKVVIPLEYDSIGYARATSNGYEFSIQIDSMNAVIVERNGEYGLMTKGGVPIYFCTNFAIYLDNGELVVE